MEPSRERPRPEDVAARRQGTISLQKRLVLSGATRPSSDTSPIKHRPAVPVAARVEVENVKVTGSTYCVKFLTNVQPAPAPASLVATKRAVSFDRGGSTASVPSALQKSVKLPSIGETATTSLEDFLSAFVCLFALIFF